MARRVGRRELLKGAAAAGLVTIGGGVEAVPLQDSQGSPEASITQEDIAAADRVAAHPYNSSDDHKQIARSWGRMRSSLRAIRAADASPHSLPAFTFDPRLPNTRVPTGKSSMKVGSPTTPVYNGAVESLAFASVVELGELLKARKVTSTQLTRMYLDRLKKFGPKLLCVVNLTEELALKQAARADEELAAGKWRGPLHGVPWGAKDLLDTKSIPTTWGAKPYEKQIPAEDATVVKRLEEAGAVLVAKLTLGELAMGDVWFGGRTNTPWNAKLGSSGSSAGPGAAVAAGLVGFAIGSETLGSIVSPSVRNGVTGRRPTFGRVPRTGAMPLSWTMDKLGPMCRRVEDCAVVLGAIFGPDGADPTVPDVPFRWNASSKLSSLRVGFDQAAFEQISKGQDEKRKKIYEDVLSTLRGLGIQLVPVTIPKLTPAYSALASITIDVEGAASFQKLVSGEGIRQLVQQQDGSWPNTFRVGGLIPAADYIRAQQLRADLQRQMAAAIKDVDLYVTPPFGSLVHTNLTGHPTLVTRCGIIDNVPQMVEFTGQLYREDAICRVGLAFEQATAHHKVWPDMEKI
jgi:Asp-tRNA(Asn)/Glu-tRNA(Gln) amidotransferase A subunit family amidase